jgi:uncharacterized membrane-anchored protein
MARSTLRVAAVVAVQLALLAAVPARQLVARTRGREITLRTAPVDPFSPFGGHYMTLAYEVERVPSFDGAQVPLNAGEAEAQRGKLVYVVVEKGEPAWTLVSASRELPSPVPGRAVLRARWEGWSFGGTTGESWMRAQIESAGRFYLPEEKAKALEAAMAAEWKRVSEVPWAVRQSGQQTRMLVDLKVDDAGNVAVVRLRFGALTIEPQ